MLQGRHKDDSYGACVICREWVPHTDEDFITVAFPCAPYKMEFLREVAKWRCPRHKDFIHGCEICERSAFRMARALEKVFK